MNDDELFSVLSEIADEEIMVKNRASIVEVGRRIRRAALEEAAKHVDLWADGRLPEYGGHALRNCAVSIRTRLMEEQQ